MRINKKLCVLLSAVILALCACGAAFAKEAAHERRIRLATDLINKMAIEEDADALANVIKSGKGVAIFPKVTKAGLGLGGRRAKGSCCCATRTARGAARPSWASTALRSASR